VASSRTAPCVLVVEDEALLLFAIADELREAGFEVLEARNAAEAIVLLEKNARVDVLFTDVDMPGTIDGIRLSQIVRDRWPPIAIIVTSGKGAQVSGALPDGAVFMPKPYGVSSVAATINRVLH